MAAARAQTLELLPGSPPAAPTYAEAIEVWRSTCPRHTIWEDSLVDGLVHVRRDGPNGSEVALTPLGAAPSPRRSSAARRFPRKCALRLTVHGGFDAQLRRHRPARPAPTRFVELFKLAEDHGFEYGWTYDSPILWQESYPLLTLAIQATERMKFGHCVTNPGTREPTVTASGTRRCTTSPAAGW